MPSPFGGLTSIGVDETGYRKGHTCITVVVDHERHRAIWAHDGYGRDVFGLFFQTLTPEQRASIRVVAGDGARWIDSCVHEWCPNAERAPDGFHIVSWTSGAPDNPRKQQKPLNSSIPLQRSHHGIRTPTRVCVHDSSNEPYPPLDGRLQYRDAMR